MSRYTSDDRNAARMLLGFFAVFLFAVYGMVTGSKFVGIVILGTITMGFIAVLAFVAHMAFFAEIEDEENS